MLSFATTQMLPSFFSSPIAASHQQTEKKKIMNYRIVFLALATMLANEAAAENWVEYKLATEREDHEASWLIDKDSIKYSGNEVRYWLKIKPRSPILNKNEKYLGCLNKKIIALYSRQEVNCADRTFSIIDAQLLCEGNLLIQDTPRKKEVSPSVPPGVDVGDMFAFCKKDYEFWK